MQNCTELRRGCFGLERPRELFCFVTCQAQEFLCQNFLRLRLHANFCTITAEIK